MEPVLSPHQLSLYNTGRMTPEQVIAAFAARRPLLDRLLADLAAETPQSRAQHHLIVGQRGMGKTMLLARIAAGLKKDDTFTGRFLPLIFAEEQYAVDRLSKFWLNCLDSLADFHEASKDQAAADAIDDEVERLTRAATAHAKNDQPFADETFAAFTAAAARTGQRPVLLVDNLQLVFERLSKEQQHSLREVLMRPGCPILIGASPSPPPATSDYGAAFYDHFKVHYLRPLEEQEMRDLLLHLASAAGRDDVRQRVLQHPARLKVLRQLTGGNPRTTLTLFFLYAEDFAPSVFGDLEGLLDRVTPLYKARLEELTDQQQVIVSAAADHWNPVTAAKLAQITALPATTISAQLDRLEKTGVVERVEVFPTDERRAEYGTTSQGYQIAERFFNVWFLFRSASRRQRREIEFLTRFLETFYEPPDRTRIAHQLMGEARISADRYLWSQAVAASLTEPETAEDLKRHTDLLALREGAEEARRKMHDLIDFNSLPPATLAFDGLRRRLMALVPEDAGVTPEEFAKAVLGDRQMFKCARRNSLAAKNSTLSKSELEVVLESMRKSTRADIEEYGEEAISWLSERLASGLLAATNDIEDWHRTVVCAETKERVRVLVDTIQENLGRDLPKTDIEVITDHLCPHIEDDMFEWCSWAYSLQHLCEATAAEQAFRYAMTRDPKSHFPWTGLGNLLAEDPNRSEESEKAFLTSLSLKPNDAVTWSCLGTLRQYRLKQYAAAETAYRKSIECDPNNGMPWFGLGNLLRDKLGQAREAEAAFRECLRREPEMPEAWQGLACVLHYMLERYPEAEAAYKRAAALKPLDAATWNDLGNLYSDRLCDLSQAELAFSEALRLAPADSIVHQNNLFLHRDYLGEGLTALPLMKALQALSKHVFPETTYLHEAIFAAYEFNWGNTGDALSKALSCLTSDGVEWNASEDWARAGAVLIHLNYGAQLLEFLDSRSEISSKLRPGVEAIRALVAGDRRALQNIAPEIRPTAEIFYDGIERRLNKLPEKTRRRPLPKQAPERKKSSR